MRSACLPLCGALLLLGAVSANDVENIHCLRECLRHPHLTEFVNSQRVGQNDTHAKALGLCAFFNQTLRCATSECPNGRPSEFLQAKLPSFLSDRCPANGSIDEAFFVEFSAVEKELHRDNKSDPCANIIQLPIWRHADESCERVSTCLVDKILAPLTKKYDAEVVTVVINFLKFWKLAKYTLNDELDALPPKCLALLEDSPTQPSAPVDEEKQNFQCLRKCQDLHVPAKQLNPNLTDAHEICEMTRHLEECALFHCTKGKASEFLSSRIPELFGVHCNDGSPDEEFFNKFEKMQAIFKDSPHLANQLPTTTFRSDLLCQGLHYSNANKLMNYFADQYGAEVVAAFVEYNNFASLSKMAEIDVHEEFSPSCLALLENRPIEPSERLNIEKENFLCLRKCLTEFKPTAVVNVTNAGLICQDASHVYRCAIQECPNGKGSEFLRHKVPEHYGAHCSNGAPDEEFFTKLQEMEKEAHTFANVNCLSDLPPPPVPIENICRSYNKCNAKVSSHFTEKYGAEVVAAVVDMETFDTLYTMAYKTDGREEFPSNCLALLDASRHL